MSKADPITPSSTTMVRNFISTSLSQMESVLWTHEGPSGFDSFLHYLYACSTTTVFQLHTFYPHDISKSPLPDEASATLELTQVTSLYLSLSFHLQILSSESFVKHLHSPCGVSRHITILCASNICIAAVITEFPRDMVSERRFPFRNRGTSWGREKARRAYRLPTPHEPVISRGRVHKQGVKLSTGEILFSRCGGNKCRSSLRVYLAPPTTIILLIYTTTPIPPTLKTRREKNFVQFNLILLVSNLPSTPPTRFVTQYLPPPLVRIRFFHYSTKTHFRTHQPSTCT